MPRVRSGAQVEGTTLMKVSMPYRPPGMLPYQPPGRVGPRQPSVTPINRSSGGAKRSVPRRRGNNPETSSTSSTLLPKETQ
jgi:hypothetical protein